MLFYNLTHLFVYPKVRILKRWVGTEEEEEEEKKIMTKMTQI